MRVLLAWILVFGVSLPLNVASAAECESGNQILTASPGPRDSTFWQLVGLYESGTRMERVGGFTLDFDLTVPPTAPCDSDGTRRDLPRCLTVDPALVANQLEVSADIPLLEGNKVDCDHEGVKGVAGLPTEPHKVPLNVKHYLGISDSILANFGEDLYHDCKYTIRVKQAPLTSDGKCLNEEMEFPFWVVPGEGSNFERETESRQYDPLTGELRAFRIKKEFRFPSDEVARHYRDELNLRNIPPYDPIDKLVRIDAEAQPSAAGNGIQFVRYQQTCNGFPVTGGGYTVRMKDGNVQSVVGRILPDLWLRVLSTSWNFLRNLEILNAMKGSCHPSFSIIFRRPRI